MVKNDVLRSVAGKLEGCSQKDVEAVLSAYAEVVIETLTNDKTEKVPMIGIGNFTAKHVDEKSGIVQLGENKGSTWHKDAEDQLVFKVSKSVKTLA